MICTDLHRNGAVGDHPPQFEQGIASTIQEVLRNRTAEPHQGALAMNPPLTNCYKAYSAARAFREEVPLHSGLYKLVEAVRELEHIWHTVNIIASHLQGTLKRRPEQSVGCCTIYEKASFLKRVPQYIADILGRKIVPSIAALHGDGLPEAEVLRCAGCAEQEARQILADCQRVQDQMRAGIREEYEYLRNGRSDLWGLLAQAESLAKYGVWMAR
jgi:hypothetical protein